MNFMQQDPASSPHQVMQTTSDLEVDKSHEPLLKKALLIPCSYSGPTRASDKGFVPTTQRSFCEVVLRFVRGAACQAHCSHAPVLTEEQKLKAPTEPIIMSHPIIFGENLSHAIDHQNFKSFPFEDDV
jgi:hypothetical protein